ncbi:class I SAM-dependent methyltransferase [Nonomuraea sp. K274]|uniref:Class I SAM-dependent methyltransferase n=1 Tax=Nonomuraea cypriaca TaxID=1187855 RepID=A0A931EYK9_9ACTN|nr:class I SAM-dependent methyltransferase [Nonomuraea cypriaca]MBF8184178.1 class I SAM-dependent methyltransferase [Nonomuraea cypriaca]
MAFPIKDQAAGIRGIDDINASNRTPVSSGDEVDQLQLWNGHHRKYWNNQERMSPAPLARLLADSVSRGHRILELGCGSGRDAVFLQGQGHAVTATDFSEFAIDENVRFRGASGVIFFVQDLRTSLAFPDSAFDAVYARLSLHYFSDTVTRGIFREIHRVLRPAGRILFTCRSTEDPLYGEGDELGPDLFRSEGQIRHFFSEEYTRNVLAEERFTIDSLILRDELVYNHHASVVQGFAHRSQG